MEIKEEEDNFTSECKGKHYSHQSLAREGSPAVWPPNILDCSRFFGGGGLVPIEVNPLVSGQTEDESEVIWWIMLYIYFKFYTILEIVRKFGQVLLIKLVDIQRLLDRKLFKFTYFRGFANGSRVLVLLKYWITLFTLCIPTSDLPASQHILQYSINNLYIVTKSTLR